ncbi:hypothetical protein ES702_01764 [subsurface metagenome]
MDPVYSIFLILALVWIGFQIIRFVGYFKKMLDLKEEEQRMKIADGQMKIQRDNANLALQNDIRGFMRSVFKKYFEEKEDPEKDPEKDEETK